MADAEGGGAGIPECPRCRSEPLDAFRPHPQRPELVLGLCWACGELYRLGPLEGGEGWRVADPAPLVERARARRA